MFNLFNKNKDIILDLLFTQRIIKDKFILCANIRLEDIHKKDRKLYKLLHKFEAEAIINKEDNEIYVEYAGSDNLAYANATQKFTFPKEEVKPTPSNTTKPSTPTKTNTPTKVTKKATKITAKKKTFKAKKKTKKYSIVLKSGKKAVKKVKVTLKVGKKTYKATTNSKGKATFKITKLNKKGKYTAVIKFKGNKNYKATSKKVKITVKK